MENEHLLKIILERFDIVDFKFTEVINRLDRIEKSQQEDVKWTLQLLVTTTLACNL